MANEQQRKLTKEEKELCRIITPEFRVSYPHLFKAQAPRPTDTPKFSITMLFPKNKEMIGLSPSGKPRSILKVIKNAKRLEFGENEAKWPKLRSPISDGDKEKFVDKEGYAGHWVIKATTGQDQKPGVVDADMTPITEASLIYPGCFARAYIFARPWEYMGKRGIQFILDHVQKMRDGKSFSGKQPVETVFSPVEAVDEDTDAEDEENF